MLKLYIKEQLWEMEWEMWGNIILEIVVVAPELLLGSVKKQNLNM